MSTSASGGSAPGAPPACRRKETLPAPPPAVEAWLPVGVARLALPVSAEDRTVAGRLTSPEGSAAEEVRGRGGRFGCGRGGGASPAVAGGVLERDGDLEDVGVCVGGAREMMGGEETGRRRPGRRGERAKVEMRAKMLGRAGVPGAGGGGLEVPPLPPPPPLVAADWRLVMEVFLRAVLKCGLAALVAGVPGCVAVEGVVGALLRRRRLSRLLVGRRVGMHAAAAALAVRHWHTQRSVAQGAVGKGRTSRASLRVE